MVMGLRQVVATPGSGTTLYFQLLTDIEGNCYAAYANPGSLYGAEDEEPFKRYDPHVDEETGEGIVDEDWTVVVVDSGLSLGAWIGDWVEAVVTGDTVTTPDGTFPVYEITARLSPQVDYFGELQTDETLTPSGSAKAAITINGSQRDVMQLLRKQNGTWDVEESDATVWDALLPEGESIGHGVTLNCKYKPDTRAWYVTGAPCYTEA